MHGLHFIPALIIASLTTHSYAQFQSKATPVECTLGKDFSKGSCSKPSRQGIFHHKKTR